MTSREYSPGSETIWSRRSAIACTAAALAVLPTIAHAEQPTAFPVAGAGLGRVQTNITVANPKPWLGPNLTVVGSRYSDRVVLTYSLLVDRLSAKLLPSVGSDSGHAIGIFTLNLPDLSGVVAHRVVAKVDLRGFVFAGHQVPASCVLSLLGTQRALNFSEGEVSDLSLTESFEANLDLPGGKMMSKSLDIGCFLAVSRADPKLQGEMTIESLDMELSFHA